MGRMLSPHVPDLPALELLRSVADEGSIGAAARLHGLSQPAVSGRMRRLEALVGLPLLERTPRGSRLTSQGAMLADWAGTVLDAAEQLDAGIEALRGTRRSRLRLAASLTVSEHLLPGWLAAWRRRSGEVSVTLAAVNSTEVARLVRGGEADLGFVEGPSVPAGLGGRVVARDELVVVVAPTHPWRRRRAPITAEELARTSLVQRETDSGTRAVLERALRGHGPIAAPVMELSTTTGVRTAAVAGAGPAVVSRLALGDDLASGRLVEVPTTLTLTRDLRAVWPKGQQPTGAGRDLLGLILSRG